MTRLLLYILAVNLVFITTKFRLNLKDIFVLISVVPALKAKFNVILI